MFSKKEKKYLMENFNLAKMIDQAGHGKLSGFNREMHREGEKELKASGLAPMGNCQIPYAVLAHRDLTVGTDSQGGYTVATELRAASFIEMLQNAIKVKTMGATWLDDLSGDVLIPSQATGATAAWEGENDENAESSPTFGQISLSPNRVGTYVEISKQLNVQSSLGVEQLIKQMLSSAIAEAIDLAALHGTGSGNQPTGLINTSGVGSVVGGTNGLAPAWTHIVDLESDVADSNGIINDWAVGYLTNTKVRGILKQVFRNETYGETPVWDVSERGKPKLNNYRAEVSNQISSTLTKGTSSGVCSALFFGDWSQLFIGMWGGLDLVIDPFTMATTNKTRITANAYADVAVGHAASFSVMLDALTS